MANNGESLPEIPTEVIESLPESAVTLLTADVDTLRPAERFHVGMLRRAIETHGQDRSSAIMAGQLEKILTVASDPDATTDDIWNADIGGVIQGRDSVGLMLSIENMVAVLSGRDDLEKNRGYYISCDAKCLGGPRDLLTRLGMEVGAEFVFQTNAELVVGKVAAFEVRDKLPISGIVVGADTRAGNTVLRLGELPEFAFSMAASETP